MASGPWVEIKVSLSCSGPFTCETVKELRRILIACFTQDEVDDVLKLSDRGEIVHRHLNDDSARTLGFQRKIH